MVFFGIGFGKGGTPTPDPNNVLAWVEAMLPGEGKEYDKEGLYCLRPG